MLKASYRPYTLKFAFVARTSREIFRQKRTYFIDIEEGGKRGTGEIAVFPSLQPSFTGFESFELEIGEVCRHINDYTEGIARLPLNSAIRFGVESALGDLRHGGKGHPFGHDALRNISGGIPINGLIWMNDADTMARQINEKLDEGFHCLKLKIGAIDFGSELGLIRSVRSVFSADKLTIRLDANGAFTSDNVMARLDALAPYSIHSVEQPLRGDEPLLTARVCRESPIDIALDEDLIERWWDYDRRLEWLGTINPRYIVLKPSLCGGFESADTWIRVADELGIGWWSTSALESNVGLGALAQWLGTHPEALDRCHGLGTGQIYTNNPDSCVYRRGERIFISTEDDSQ